MYANLQRVSKMAKKSRFAFLYLQLRLRMRQNKILYNLQQKLVQKSSLTIRKRFCRMQSLVAFGNRALKKPL